MIIWLICLERLRKEIFISCSVGGIFVSLSKVILFIIARTCVWGMIFVKILKKMFSIASFEMVMVLQSIQITSSLLLLGGSNEIFVFN